jgi:DNA modification methylase
MVEIGSATLYHGDCREILRTLPDCSVDSVVTDPPYGLAFMGKKWDYDVPAVEIWAECLRVLKPGGHLLAFAGTRTQHRMAVRIDDAGFEIRDMILWIYGSGFPKSLDISKAIDRKMGAEREVVGTMRNPAGSKIGGNSLNMSVLGMPETAHITAPATPEARQWQGWGTALKPAVEPITMARKPFAGTMADNVLAWGTGGVNVDGCRVGIEFLSEAKAGQAKIGTFERGIMITPERYGRWPANLIHDGSEEATAGMPEDDNGGSAARYFYCAKASKADRDDGLGSLQHRTAGECVDREEGSAGMQSPRAGAGRTNGARNHHPTVKPTELMAYLCRLVTPPGGIVLDPFMGSGSTGRGALQEGFYFIGIEREAEYLEVAAARIKAMADIPKQGDLFRSPQQQEIDA